MADLFDIAIARKLSGGGGGGGGFSTAKVTFISSANSYKIYGHTVAVGNPVTLEFPLFEANGFKIFTIEIGLAFEGISQQVMPTVTGGVTLGDELDVSGDGTFTAAGVITG